MFRLGQVLFGQLKTCKIRTGWIMPEKSGPGLVKSCQDRSGRGRLGQVKFGQVRLGQCLLLFRSSFWGDRY